MHLRSSELPPIDDDWCERPRRARDPHEMLLRRGQRPDRDARGAGTRAIPIVALTAAASERDWQRGIHAGFYRYLTNRVDELMSAEAIFSDLYGL